MQGLRKPSLLLVKTIDGLRLQFENRCNVNEICCSHSVLRSSLHRQMVCAFKSLLRQGYELQYTRL